MNTLNIHLFYLSHRPKMVDVLHHHLARMYGAFVFNLIYCHLPSSIAGREDFSTERGTFCFSLFIFLVSFHKENFQFYPFSLDTLTRSWATQTMLWLQTAGEMYHSGFRYDETITVFLLFSFTQRFLL